MVKGRPPRGPEVTHPELWSGISVFDSIDAIRDVMHRHRMPVRLVARLEIPDDGRLLFKKTLGRGHYTIWGEAELIRRCVVSIRPVEELP